MKRAIVLSLLPENLFQPARARNLICVLDRQAFIKAISVRPFAREESP
jgi:hypothetical protein